MCLLILWVQQVQLDHLFQVHRMVQCDQWDQLAPCFLQVQLLLEFQVVQPDQGILVDPEVQEYQSDLNKGIVH